MEGERHTKTLAERKAAAKKRHERWLWLLNPRNFDLFGHEPDYTFPGYRSAFGVWASVLLACVVFLRVVTRAIDFIFPDAIISENRLMFAHDMTDPLEVPRFGLVFKQTGWKPLYDPTYFTFQFQQGYSGRASNSTYTDLGDEPCSFVDVHGRIIEDEARCPSLLGEAVGNFFDTRFRFVHVALKRCHNGTDAQGRSQPGPCRRPDEIDDLVYRGQPPGSRSRRPFTSCAFPRSTALLRSGPVPVLTASARRRRASQAPSRSPSPSATSTRARRPSIRS